MGCRPKRLRQCGRTSGIEIELYPVLAQAVDEVQLGVRQTDASI